MQLKIINFFQSKAVFWKVKLFFQQKISFKLFRELYGIHHSIREHKISAILLRHSLGGFLKNLLYSAVFIFLFEFLAAIFPYEIPFSPAKDELGLLLTAVATVCGVFLGLYFTAVSAAAGNLFMRAPENLQKLFLRERRGRQYIRTLTFTTVISLSYLFLQALGYTISPLGPIVIIVLAGYAVFRFLYLGPQTFYFIHPEEAASTIRSDTAYAIQNACAGGFGWDKPFLQNHYKIQAQSALASLRSLINFGIETVKLSEEQLVTIANYAKSLFIYYLGNKKKIPTQSYWYRTKTQFPNWILADSSAIAIALNTGTSLLPQEIKDWTWFEEECIDIILELFEHFITKNQLESAQFCIEILVSVTENLGKDFYKETSELIIDKVMPIFMAIVEQNNESEIIDKRVHQLALIDSYGRLGIASLIGFVNHLNKRTADDLVSEIKNTKWVGKASLYKSSLPGKLLPALESTASKYKTEKIVEGRTLSPEWYLITIISQQYLFELKIYFDFVKALHNNFFKKNIDRLIDKKQHLLAAHLIDRWIEFANKLATCGFFLQRLIDGCAKLRQVKDLPWIEIDFEIEKNAIESINKEAVDKLIYLLPILNQLQPTSQEMPDYFGQAYTFGVEACYQACINNEQERFKMIFPPVFLGAIAAYESARKKVDGWLQESQIIFSTEPLEDLLCLSGYAKIYAELHENQELWKVCEDTWELYLSTIDAKQFLSFISLTAEFRDSQFKIMPKATLRINWDTQFNHKLQELGLIRDLFEERHFGRRQSANHSSPLIRAIAIRESLLGPKSRDVFFTTYLNQHPAAQGIEFPDRRGLRRRIDREANRDQEQTENNEKNPD